MKKINKKILKMLKNPKVERALKTFIEVFSSYIAVNVMTVDLSSKTAIMGLIAGAIGSAISVLINYKVETQQNV